METRDAGTPGRIGAVRVLAPARLHLGFLDLNGGLGRRFGSLGLALDGIATVLTLRPAAGDRIVGAGAPRAMACLRRLRGAWGMVAPVELVIERAIPAHAGLGSGTQLGLAIGAAYARLLGAARSVAEVATLLGRGGRSGVGIGAFTAGGFLVDGGKGPGDTAPPPIIARLPFPEPWRVLLVHDPRLEGKHGSDEAATFKTLATFPAERAAHLCRLTLLVLLPGIARADLAAVSAALAEIQGALGDHFAPFQGGGRFTSPAVGEAMAWIEGHGVRGIGQSSWGPTGWALLPDAIVAERIRAEAERRFAGRGLMLRIVAGRNRPGEIETIDGERREARA
jgi:beta-RFAP synthase